ncbi:MAG TPA: acetolactate synthase small subunit [Candidatus Hydrogenedentes bacterium]|nr:acetolactate synthase small subunit [Candidatus Hydrogenedentota bacterium]
MKHTLSCLVKNQRGVLARVSEAFASAGISIDSLAVAETEDTEVSRATIVVSGDEATLAEAERQCEALDVVLQLEDLASEEFYARELLLLKVRIEPDTITRIMQAAELFEARVIGMSDRTITLELAGEHRAIDGLLKMMRPLGIVALARSGLIAVSVTDEEELDAAAAPLV